MKRDSVLEGIPGSIHPGLVPFLRAQPLLSGTSLFGEVAELAKDSQELNQADRTLHNMKDTVTNMSRTVSGISAHSLPQTVSTPASVEWPRPEARETLCMNLLRISPLTPQGVFPFTSAQHQGPGRGRAGGDPRTIPFLIGALTSYALPRNDESIVPVTQSDLSASVKCPVGRRLQRFYASWEVITDDDCTLSVVRRGYVLQFLQHPKLTSTPPFSCIPVRPRSTDILIREVATLLEKQAIVELLPPYTPGFYSHIFMVTKKDSDKLRLVINLSPLNKLLVKNRFKTDTPSTITYALQQGDWTISVNLTDAYLHVPMHPSVWKFLRCVVGRRVYEFRALPFGLSPAPYVFSRVMSTISRAAHKRLLHLFLYLDDSLLRNSMRERLCQQIPVCLGLFDSLGFLRNYKKSSLVPSQTFIFLGVFYDLLLAIARIPEDRRNKIASLIPAILANMNQAMEKQIELGLSHLQKTVVSS
jgi:hypothetical protein